MLFVKLPISDQTKSNNNASLHPASRTCFKTIYPVVYPVIFIDIPIKSHYIPLHSHWISYECVQSNYIPDIPRYIPMILPLIIPYMIIILCFSHVLFSRYPIVLLSHDPIIFPLNICHASRIPLLKIEEMPAHEYPHERYPINLHDTTKIASSDSPILFPSYSLIILLTSMNPLWIPSLYSQYLSQSIPTKYPMNYISEIFPWYSQVYIYIHILLLSIYVYCNCIYHYPYIIYIYTYYIYYISHISHIFFLLQTNPKNDFRTRPRWCRQASPGRVTSPPARPAVAASQGNPAPVRRGADGDRPGSEGKMGTEKWWR